METRGVRLAIESTGLDEEAALESLVEESLGTEIKRNALSTYCWMRPGQEAEVGHLRLWEDKGGGNHSLRSREDRGNPSCEKMKDQGLGFKDRRKDQDQNQG